jgi:hypothetical protein
MNRELVRPVAIHLFTVRAHDLVEAQQWSRLAAHDRVRDAAMVNLISVV